MNDRTGSATDTTAERQARRLVALEVQVAELERSRRRTMVLGPILLLVLANVTPVVVARPKNDPDVSYTLFQALAGAPKVLPIGWFLLLGVAGLACAGAAITLRPSVDRFRRSPLVVSVGVGVLVVLAAFVVAVYSASTKTTTFNPLTPAVTLAAAAAIWLIVAARSARD